MTDQVPTELVNYRITAPAFDEELELDDDPSALVTHLPLEIRQGDLLVGKVDALLFHVGEAIDVGVSVFDVFDSIDQDVHEMYSALFDHETDELLEEVAEPSGGSDVLYVRSIRIIPSRRGQRLGLRAIQRLRRSFGGGCAVLALKAHPLSPDPNYVDVMDREVFGVPFPVGEDAAKERLRAYWSTLGFRRVRDTDYMTFDMSEKPPGIR